MKIIFLFFSQAYSYLNYCLETNTMDCSLIYLFGILLKVCLLLAVDTVGLSATSPAVWISNDTKVVGRFSSGTESFLNIRYAEDTSGRNRFLAPRAFSYINATVHAAEEGKACPQSQVDGLFTSTVDQISEDCLNLRVDRLEGTTASSKLPVVVWIFGGGFATGPSIHLPIILSPC